MEKQTIREVNQWRNRGQSVAEACKKAGITPASYYNYLKKEKITPSEAVERKVSAGSPERVLAFQGTIDALKQFRFIGMLVDETHGVVPLYVRSQLPQAQLGTDTRQSH